MPFYSFRSRIEDVERDVGAMSMDLQANEDHTQKDFANLTAQLSGLVEDVEEIVDDVEEFYEELTDRQKDGVTGGRAQEMLGNLEDAKLELDQAKMVLAVLAKDPTRTRLIEDATCSLDETTRFLADASGV